MPAGAFMIWQKASGWVGDSAAMVLAAVSTVLLWCGPDFHQDFLFRDVFRWCI